MTFLPEEFRIKRIIVIFSCVLSAKVCLYASAVYVCLSDGGRKSNKKVGLYGGRSPGSFMFLMHRTNQKKSLYLENPKTG